MKAAMNEFKRRVAQRDLLHYTPHAQEEDWIRRQDVSESAPNHVPEGSVFVTRFREERYFGYYRLTYTFVDNLGNTRELSWINKYPLEDFSEDLIPVPRVPVLGYVQLA